MSGQSTRRMRRCQTSGGVAGFPLESCRRTRAHLEMHTHAHSHTHVHTHTHIYPNLLINSEMLALKMNAKKTPQAESSKTHLLIFFLSKLYIPYWSTNSIRTQVTPPNPPRSAKEHVTRQREEEIERWEDSVAGGSWRINLRLKTTWPWALGRKTFSPPSFLFVRVLGAFPKACPHPFVSSERGDDLKVPNTVPGTE